MAEVQEGVSRELGNTLLKGNAQSYPRQLFTDMGDGSAQQSVHIVMLGICITSSLAVLTNNRKSMSWRPVIDTVTVAACGATRRGRHGVRAAV